MDEYSLKDCKLCGEERDKWGRLTNTQRKFLLYDNGQHAVCCTCGYRIKLNTPEVS